jgi:hypothetical protein
MSPAGAPSQSRDWQWRDTSGTFVQTGAGKLGRTNWGMTCA